MRVPGLEVDVERADLLVGDENAERFAGVTLRRHSERDHADLTADGVGIVRLIAKTLDSLFDILSGDRRLDILDDDRDTAAELTNGHARAIAADVFLDRRPLERERPNGVIGSF